MASRRWMASGWRGSSSSVTALSRVSGSVSSASASRASADRVSLVRCDRYLRAMRSRAGSAGQPVAARPDQLVHLVGGHPVVLGVVEHGQQHVQVVERVGQPDLAGQPQVQVGRRAPFLRRERLAFRGHGPAERLEESAGQVLAAAAAQGGDVDFERDLVLGECGARVAAAGQRGAEGFFQRHGKHAGGGVRAVVDVLGEFAVARPVPAGRPADQGHRVDLEQQRGGAALGGRLGVEHMRRAGRGSISLQPVGVLVQQVPEVRGGRPGGGDGQQHSVIVPGLRRARWRAWRPSPGARRRWSCRGRGGPYGASAGAARCAAR